MKPARFRKKPVVIDAMQLPTFVSADELKGWREFAGEAVIFKDGFAIIPTLEGPMRAEIGDWIIKGIKGEFYPCKPDIFAASYEVADDEPTAIEKKPTGELEYERTDVPAGELYRACGCSDPPDSEGATPNKCGKEAVAIWNIAYCGVLVAQDQHACARHDRDIQKMVQVKPLVMRQALKRVELADSASGGIRFA